MPRRMMQADTPKLGDYEGLVFKTAQMFASQVKYEEEDLRQELRIVVWRAVQKYNPARTRMPIKGWVYGCVANKIKEYKRNAARRAAYGLSFGHIEDHRNDMDTLDHFELTYYSTVPEQVYGRVDEGLLTLPATLTAREADVLVLAMFDLSEREIRLRLGIPRGELEAIFAKLRTKLADWNPGQAAVARPLALAA